jgi:hypothetical protein
MLKNKKRDKYLKYSVSVCIYEVSYLREYMEKK